MKTPIHVRLILLMCALGERLKSWKAKQINKGWHKRQQKHKAIDKWRVDVDLKAHALANERHNRLDKQDERDDAIFKLLKGGAL